MAAWNLIELAKALRGNLNGRWINIPGPGHSRSDRSLGFRIDANAPDGFRVYSLAGDDERECRACLKARLARLASQGAFAIECSTNLVDSSKAERNLQLALAIWQQATPVNGTIAEKYLANRGLLISSETLATDALRFHPCCPFGPHRFPALIALIRDVMSEVPRGIIRIALKDDGAGKREMAPGRSPKMIIGAAKGGAVMLHPCSEHLGIAEGIETALSARQIFGVPVWAALSANGIATFPIIYGLKRLTIFADHDVVGLKAARTCAARYAGADIAGEIHHPSTSDDDWNDHLQREQHSWR